jgi:hypothetical protein
MAVVNAFIKLSDTAYQKLPMRDRLKDIIEGFFRVFDSNGNGIIESFELSEIVSDGISGIATITATVIDCLEPQFLKANDPPPFKCLLLSALASFHRLIAAIHLIHQQQHRPRQEPLDGLARIYVEKLLEHAGEEPFPTAKIIDFILRHEHGGTVLPSTQRPLSD